MTKTHEKEILKLFLFFVFILKMYPYSTRYYHIFLPSSLQLMYSQTCKYIDFDENRKELTTTTKKTQQNGMYAGTLHRFSNKNSKIMFTLKECHTDTLHMQAIKEQIHRKTKRSKNITISK